MPKRLNGEAGRASSELRRFAVEESALEDLSAVSISEPAQAGLKDKVEALERGLIFAAMDAAKGNVWEAARQLRIARATLHDKLGKYRSS